MANQFTTTDQLKFQALWLAGEPTNGTSDYEDQVLNWMQLVYDTILNGGTLGTRDIAISAGLYNQLINIPTTDWKWLRKFPPYAFNTTPAVIGSSSSIPLNQGEQIGTVSLTYGSDIINFSIAPSQSVETWRLVVLDQAEGVPNPPITVPRIKNHDANVQLAVLDAPWPQETQIVSNFALAPLEYQLPSDFIRFCESPLVQGGYDGYGVGPGPGSGTTRLAIGDYEQVLDNYPLQDIEIGPPDAASRLDTTTIMVNRYDTFSYRIEYSYVYQVPALAVNEVPAQEPVVPLRFRHIIAIGAAMMIGQDKVDGRTDRHASEFREILTQMQQEYRKEGMAGSERMGRMLFRNPNNRRRLLRSTSGIPIW